MKKIPSFISLLLTVFLCDCINKYPEHPDYILTGEQTGYYSFTDSSGELVEQFGLTFNLKTKSENLAPIYLMTCSWDDHAVTNNSDIVMGTPCNKNFMSWTRIKKGEYLELITTVQPTKGYGPTSSSFRVAFIAIDTMEFDFKFYLNNPEADSYLDSLKAQKKRQIWSNEIELKRLNTNERLPSGKWTKKEGDI